MADFKGTGLGDIAQWAANRSNEQLELYYPFFLSVNYATGLQTMTFECADCLGGSMHVYVMEKDDLLDRGTLLCVFCQYACCQNVSI